LSFYKNSGWNESDYPKAMGQFRNEISLPIYFDLTDEQVDYISESIIEYMSK
jgi:dTDP-4-amino-4,6-dideoxygalactose transaminase